MTGITKVMNYCGGEILDECVLCDLKLKLWHKLLKCVYVKLLFIILGLTSGVWVTSGVRHCISVLEASLQIVSQLAKSHRAAHNWLSVIWVWPE